MLDPTERVPAGTAEPQEILTVTLDCTMLVELADLSASLGALAQQHERFADKIGASINGDRIRLHVKEIRPGSIIIELLALAQTAAPPVGAVNTVVPFAKNVAEFIGYAVGKNATPPDGTSAKDVCPGGRRSASAVLAPPFLSLRWPRPQTSRRRLRPRVDGQRGIDRQFQVVKVSARENGAYPLAASQA